MPQYGKRSGMRYGYFPFESVYFDTSTIIITLILIGRLLESRTKEKASMAVRKLLDLQPRMAKIIGEGGEGGVEVEVPIEYVKEGRRSIGYKAW
jgi:P-type Cu+ transporter